MSAAVGSRSGAWGFPEGVVFVAGISTLGAEIAAARLIAPAFGASTVVWANTIAIVLVALAGGYWLGGRLADRHPHARGLARTALLGAALVALIPLLAIPLLDVTEDSLGEFSGLAARADRAGRAARARARRAVAVGDPAADALRGRAPATSPAGCTRWAPRAGWSATSPRRSR